MNRVELVGRLTKDIELKKTNSDLSVCQFTLAVSGLNKTTDFINCVAWRQSAEFLSKYAHKGNRIGLEGRISTRSYDGKNGKVYVTEVTADRVELLESVQKQDNQEVQGVPEWDGYKSNNPSINGETINTDDCPFY